MWDLHGLGGQDKTTLVVTPSVAIYAVFPVFLLDAVFFLWVFFALFHTIQMLNQSGSVAKLTM